jgi:hypothetical protein
LKAGPTLQIWAVDGAEAEQGKISSFAVDFKLEKVNSDFYSAIQEKKSKSLVKGIAPHMCHYSDLRSEIYSLQADILL